PVEQVSGTFGTHAAGAGDLVRRVPAQCDEVGHLMGIDAVSFPYFGWTDSRHLARAHGKEDGCPFRGQLESIAVTACHQHRSAGLLLLRTGGGEKVVRLVAGRLRVRETAGGHEIRQHVQLLDQSFIELATTLIVRKFLMPLGWHVQGVPSDEYRSWPLRLV